MKNIQKKFRTSLLFILIAILLLGGGAYIYTHANRTNQPTGSKMYISQSFGLSFTYNASQAKIKETSTRIYVYFTGSDPLQGQWVEKFNKLRSETFRQSIRRQILANFTSPGCTIEISSSTEPSGYEVAQIGEPPAGTDNPSWANAPLCNQTYDETNGIQYFLYDPNHPDHFYFFSIGQYGIPATDLIDWQGTVIIL